MERFWSEAVYIEGSSDYQVEPGKLAVPAPEGRGVVVFTLRGEAHPTQDELKAAVETVITDLQNAEE